MILIDKLKTGVKIGAFISLGFFAFKCSNEVRPPIVRPVKKAGSASFDSLYCSNVNNFGYVFEGNNINAIDGSVYNELTLMEEEGPDTSRYMITFLDVGPEGIVDKIKIIRRHFTDIDTTDMLYFDFRSLKKIPRLYPGSEKDGFAILPNKKAIYDRVKATKDYAKVIEAIFE